MRDVVITAASRTAIGAFQGGLSSVSAVELGSTVIRSVIGEIDPAAVDEVIMGHVLRAGTGQNTARQAAIHAGLPKTVPAMTIDRVCGSGLSAVTMAARAIHCGDADIVVAGGMESMSLAPYVLPKARTGLRMGHAELLDSLLHDGLWDAFNDYHMGVTAENLVERYGITRQAQDDFAIESQRRACAARESGRFDAEITPVEVQGRRGEITVMDRDEQPRDGVSLESLSRLRPAFSPQGSVTAGNASTLNDGAAAVLVMSRERADALGLPIMATIRSYGEAAVDPAFMGIGPVPATRRCLERARWAVSDLELVEANEAFAAQAMAVQQEIGWPSGCVNVNGGAIALGHPIGASGARILVSLLHEMTRRDVHRGLATLCVGGGQGVAMAVERS